jgi:glycosyltransferase involved in cell wall biosynthesis
MTPPVSILTAVYNSEPFIERTIGAVLAQTFGDFEWIVVDDGSTDRTPEIVAAIDDPRVRLIRRTNGGPSAARNTGLEHVRAELVALLDHDDVWAPERLERLVHTLEDGTLGMVSSNMRVGDPEHPEGARTILDNPTCAGTDLDDVATWIQGCGLSASTIAVRADALRRHGGWREDLWYAQDWELTLRLWLAGLRVAMLPEPLGWTVMREGQLSGDSWGIFRDRRTVLRELASRSDRPDVAAEAKARLRSWQRDQALVALGEALAHVDDDPRFARERFRWSVRHGLPPKDAAVAVAGAISPRTLARVRRVLGRSDA